MKNADIDVKKLIIFQVLLSDCVYSFVHLYFLAGNVINRLIVGF